MNELEPVVALVNHHERLLKIATRIQQRTQQEHNCSINIENTYSTSHPHYGDIGWRSKEMSRRHKIRRGKQMLKYALIDRSCNAYRLLQEYVESTTI